MYLKIIVIILLFLIFISLYKSCVLIENLDTSKNSRPTYPKIAGKTSDNKEKKAKYISYDGLQNCQNTQKGTTYLSLKNASNISYLEERFKELEKLEINYNDLENQVKNNTKTLKNITTELGKQLASSSKQKK